ncbi:MAG: hypothetical protein ACLTWK_12055 [Eisenbergiella sp.]
MTEIINRNDLLDKLRIYSSAPDDENIKYKEKIRQALLKCPELLYAIHEPRFEKMLFNDDGSINYDGEWDLYFGTSSNIRPYLYIPDSQDEVHNFVTYQVGFTETPKYNDTRKYTTITFNIFVHGNDGIDKFTGIPRHDLIACIIRDRFNWSNIFGVQCKLVSSKESLTDNNYISRTMLFELYDFNGIVKTSYDDGETDVINNGFWR